MLRPSISREEVFKEGEMLSKGYCRSILGLFVVLTVGLILHQCAPTNDDGPENDGPTLNIEGEYNITLGPQPIYTMNFTENENNQYEFYIAGKLVDVQGTGTLNGTTMTITADVPFLGPLTGTLTFSQDGRTFQGSFEISGAVPIQSTITGTTADYEIRILDQDGIPLFVQHNCIELAKIAQISRFRSGAGHDFSDDFENCRNMEHMFYAKDNVDIESIKLYSPVDGTIIGWTDEWEDQETYKGRTIGIQPDNDATFAFLIFNLNPDRDFSLGDKVSAGEKLGTSQKDEGTVSNIAVYVHVPGGHKLISFFEVMSNPLFQIYRNRGVRFREDAIIDSDERDGAPLNCIGEDFANSGTIENFVYLN